MILMKIIKMFKGDDMDPKMTISEAAAFLNISPQAVHQRIKSKDLPVQRRQSRFYFGYETAKSLFNLNFKKKSYAIQNIKGGVGKTETTNCIAIGATLYGAKVLCIDLDSQANLTKDCFKVNPKDKPIILDIIKDKIPVENSIINIHPGLDLIPSDIDNGILDNTLMLGRFPLDLVFKDFIENLKRTYDFIFIDCPPALTASVTAAELAVDEVIAPVTPDIHAFSGFHLLKNEIHSIEERYKTSIPLKIFLNMYDARNDLSHVYYEDLKSSDIYKQHVYKTYVRKSQCFPNAIEVGETIYDTFRTTSAKEDMHLLIREILKIG